MHGVAFDDVGRCKGDGGPQSKAGAEVGAVTPLCTQAARRRVGETGRADDLRRRAVQVEDASSRLVPEFA